MGVSGSADFAVAVHINKAIKLNAILLVNGTNNFFFIIRSSCKFGVEGGKLCSCGAKSEGYKRQYIHPRIPAGVQGASAGEIQFPSHVAIDAEHNGQPKQKRRFRKLLNGYSQISHNDQFNQGSGQPNCALCQKRKERICPFPDVSVRNG